MLPDIVQIAISLAVTALVVQGLNAAAIYFGRPELSTNSKIIATAVVGIVIFAGNTILTLVVALDPDAKSKVDLLLQILVLLLSAAGIKPALTALTNTLASAVAKSLKGQ